MILVRTLTFLDLGILDEQLRGLSSSAKYHHIDSVLVEGSYNISIHYTDSLSTLEVEEIDQLVTEHQTNTPTSFDFILEVSRTNQQDAIAFGQGLLHDWMRKNVIEGMSIKQSLWVFSRFEDFHVTCDFGSRKVDIFKMFQSGAMPTVYYCLLQVIPDPMTENYHWVTEARMEWILLRIRAHIGEGMASYVESLISHD
jgi:hypothetical protein